MPRPTPPAVADPDLDPEAESAGDAPARTGIQSIEVGFRLLDVLARTNGPMMLRDLARAAPMNPAKAHRYMVSFTRLGLVTQTPEGRYDLGPFASEMGLVSLNRQDPMRRARPAAAVLRDEIDHTIGLAVWGNQGPAIVHWEEASQPVTVSLRLGDVMPMLNSATGRVFGAYLPRAQTLPFIQREQDPLAAAGATADNPEHPRTLEAYDAICAEVRARGVTRIHGGVLPGINAMSLPVFDANGQLCLALIALGAQSTFDTTADGPLERRLRQAVQQLSADLGYVPPTSRNPDAQGAGTRTRRWRRWGVVALAALFAHGIAVVWVARSHQVMWPPAPEQVVPTLLLLPEPVHPPTPPAPSPAARAGTGAGAGA